MDTGKKLLFVSFSQVPAIDRHTAFVTGAVRSLGRLFEEIDVVTIKGDFVAHIERFHGSRLLRVPLGGDNAIEKTESFRRAIRRQIDSDSYDVVHVRSPLEGSPINQAREDKGYRVVYEAGTFAVHDALGAGLSDDELLRLDSSLLAEEITCAEQADLVLVHSDAARRALRARGVTSPIDVIPAGVNIDIFDWDLGTDPSLPTLLVLGRLAPWRDVTTVLTALRRAQEITPVFLRWVGEPDQSQREAFAAYAQELGLEGLAVFEPPPEPDTLPWLINSVTACLAPAAPEPRFTEWGDQPTGLLEFLACRQPVIAARVPGVEEVVRDGTEAILYPPGDTSALTSSILYLVRNPPHREILAKRGYRRVREQFSESAHRRALLQAYRALVSSTSSYPATLDTANDSADLPGVTREFTEAEPITAVVEEVGDGSGSRADQDTRPVRAFETPNGHLDTQPHIQPAARTLPLAELEAEGEPWVLPETTPHAVRPTEPLPETPPTLPRPPTLPIEDTSRIAPPVDDPGSNEER